MEKEIKDTYVILSVKDLADIEPVSIITEADQNDIVLSMDSSIEFSDDLGELLGEITEVVTEKEKCIVMVHESVELMDALDDYCVCVPTLSEAHDYIYMEQLERNF